MLSLMECDVSSPGDYWKAEGARLEEGRGGGGGWVGMK